LIQPERVQVLKDVPAHPGGRYVLYWMQQSQRAAGNPALEYAARAANELERPLLVAFGLDSDYPEANERHFSFMLQGLAETVAELASRGVKTVVSLGSPPAIAARWAADAAIVICDRGYLRHQRQWRRELVRTADRRVVMVEGDVVVPVETASDKREWAARTIRAKINGPRDRYIKALHATSLRKSSLPLHVRGDVDVREWRRTLDRLTIDRSVPAVDRFEGGTSVARRRLTNFLRDTLPGYAQRRSDPSDPQVSGLGPYLHFGQISPVEIVAKVQCAGGASEPDKEAFLEELVVRRELAVNFVFYAPDYDKFRCLPDWARESLLAHKADPRPERYTRAQLEAARTADDYWNAAMTEMLHTGYMHNHMRMYWGKKILEWCNTPEYAFRTVLYLNNKYFLDGRDPSSYANVGWIFGLHDQAWQERPVFGKVRYMSAGGLRRKFDMDRYVARVRSLGAGWAADSGG
jgi:deoxyribodipyrimidine photo-lyase